ncbi:hypothetical protein PV11_09265 [Exophiala sideris]|uniref:Zn(2)-C6 fungal-type domain-containing protein n=1 Tax=Exophiala sideris TaxID=1016849 RepID=A0A0D1VN85_9EURO|nr:hypothetical protein PV11_09265 [Exophiala sideris]
MASSNSSTMFDFVFADDDARRAADEIIDSDSFEILRQETNTRVCDRCILKKVKCNMKRPSCSRCLDGNFPCVYSNSKRKPGPRKGMPRKSAIGPDSRMRSGPSNKSTVPDTGPTLPQDISDYSAASFLPSLQQPTDLSVPSFPPDLRYQVGTNRNQTVEGTFSTGPPLPYTQPPPSLDSSVNPPISLIPDLRNDQERELMNHFFAHIHPSIPLFDEARFFHQYELAMVDGHLLLTICVVTAKILGQGGYWNENSLDDRVKYLLDTESISNATPTSLSLDNFRQACLLAFYEFHQHPGDAAWLRIGQLTRKAYQCGLHQIDSQNRHPILSNLLVKDADTKGWRYLWWCIYCLDSYSNITAATPFVVETESIATALITVSQDNQQSQAQVFLPVETSQLWSTIRDITRSCGDFDFNMHIITTLFLREASTLRRLQICNPSARLNSRQAALEECMSAIRLALPARYLNAIRDVLKSETPKAHHARLISVLHLHAARIFLTLPTNPPQQDQDLWQTGWQQTIESCEDIVAVVQQWDSQFSSTVDPAICFIILAALVLLHLHQNAYSSEQHELGPKNLHKEVLLLFLEQFATSWRLPRLLISSFQTFSQLVSGPLTSDQIHVTLRRIPSPSQDWLNYLPDAHESGSASMPERAYTDLFSQGWNFDHWA